jgi:hypothetical protein
VEKTKKDLDPALFGEASVVDSPEGVIICGTL